MSIPNQLLDVICVSASLGVKAGSDVLLELLSIEIVDFLFLERGEVEKRRVSSSA